MFYHGKFNYNISSFPCLHLNSNYNSKINCSSKDLIVRYGTNIFTSPSKLYLIYPFYHICLYNMLNLLLDVSS